MQFNSVFGYATDDSPLCYRDGGALGFGDFTRALAGACGVLRERLPRDAGQPSVALYSDDSYEFCVLLFAALACDAQVVIPANNKRSTIRSLQRDVTLWLGEWDAGDVATLGEVPATAGECEVPRNFSGAIQLFTSGSSGEPQRVDKTLAQLLREIAAQQRHWGALTSGATVLATVSHQHIYGLLFKLLWPLASGRAFVGKTYVDVAGLLRDAEKFGPAIWVASPAQLSRRIESWPWDRAASLRAIFSSGGPLAAEDAEQIAALGGLAPIEIYGSTETGGIAWRRQAEGDLWRPLDGVEIDCSDEGLLRVNSPWLDRSFAGQDRVHLDTRGFRLLGRADRIVKIEEKRISLSQIETLLCRSDWIAAARTLTLKRGRDCVAAVAVLSEGGRRELAQRGKSALVRALRGYLAPDLEGVALPRLWRFVREIPTNQQGKSPRELLMQVFDATPPAMLPRVESREAESDRAWVVMTIPGDLICLPGHFAGAPVVPGVVQIDWAMHYGRELLGISDRFASMEVIKFKQLMVPGERVTLELEFNPEKNKLKFRFRCAGGESREYSSGQLCFDHG